MSASTSFLLIAVILMVVQHNTFGLTCYYCDGGTDGCGASFNSKGAGVIQISGASTTYCAKVVSSSNTNAIARSPDSSVCTGATTTVTASTTSTGTDGMTYYCCTTNLCNESSMKSASVLLSMVAAAMSFFFLTK